MTTTTTQPRYSTYAIVGFVLAFIIPIAGLVVSIIGMRDARNNQTRGYKLAAAGLIVGIVLTLLTIIRMVEVFIN